MRRSQAPSIRKAAKMGAGAASKLNANNKDGTSMNMDIQWGTSGGYKGFRPKKYEEGENPLMDKRIFLVLWRKQSNKKHKTWKGNGTLELTPINATLKDETGKIMDVLTSYKQTKIQEDALIEIGMRDIEIQVELKTAEECILQRKEEIENWYRQQEESNGMVSGHNDIASIPQRPIKTLKKPKRSLESTSPNKSSSCTMKAAASSFKINEFICLLAPAELQQQTLQLLADYARRLEMKQIHASAGIFEVIAQHTCDHPVLLKHIEHQPIISEVLQPHLPPWQEMGLYDSAKFEFVHLMLDNLVVAQGEKCAIIANSQQCLDIIIGYCQCWDIPHIQVADNSQANCFNTTDANDAQAPMVALLLASELPAMNFTCCKSVILYNYSARSAASHLFTADAYPRIYTLITSGCFEERQFQQELGLVDSCEKMDFINLSADATHKLLNVAQNTLGSWSQWLPPFNESFLKETFFCDQLPSLKCIFNKQNENQQLHVI